jgi:hypothetical protein
MIVSFDCPTSMRYPGAWQLLKSRAREASKPPGVGVMEASVSQAGRALHPRAQVVGPGP